MSEQEYFIADEPEMLHFGANLAQMSHPGDIIFLTGQLGAGKTTIVRGFLQQLGHTGIVKSPTYTLVENYFLKNLSVFHFDLYRLNTPQELIDMGIEDYFIEQAICLIEWPEKAKQILPNATISCTIEIPKNGIGRKIKVMVCL